MNPVNTSIDIIARRRVSLTSIALTLLALHVPVIVFAQDGPAPSGGAEDTRTQYPVLLRNSYFSLNLGYIDYGFTNLQLEPGFSAESIETPRIAVRAVLIGHQFHRYLSVQAHYARPVLYASSHTINGEPGGHHVWMHFGGVTAKSQLVLSRRLSAFGEGGLGLTSRSGFEEGTTPVVRDAHFANLLLGAGIEYHVNPKWDLLAGTLYSQGNTAQNQP